MNFGVPQFIDIEDKIAFQLTAKQLGWFALAGVLLFFAWNFLEGATFGIVCGLIVITSVALVFIKPYGVSLPAFIGHGFMFLVRPKVFIWRKYVEVGVENNDRLNSKNSQPKIEKLARTPEEVEKMADNLDSHNI